MAQLMRTSNPALSSDAFRTGEATVGESMTVSGTVNKTGILLLCCVATAAWTWNRFFNAPPEEAMEVMAPALAIGGIGGFIVAIVTIFKKEWAGITAPIYALLEGLVLRRDGSVDLEPLLQRASRGGHAGDGAGARHRRLWRLHRRHRHHLQERVGGDPRADLRVAGGPGAGRNLRHAGAALPRHRHPSRLADFRHAADHVARLPFRPHQGDGKAAARHRSCHRRPCRR